LDVAKPGNAEADNRTDFTPAVIAVFADHRVPEASQHKNL
jgi:hypothetical protein